MTANNIYPTTVLLCLCPLSPHIPCCPDHQQISQFCPVRLAWQAVGWEETGDSWEGMARGDTGVGRGSVETFVHTHKICQFKV